MRRLMFIAISRRRSPSTGNFAMTSRKRAISGSVKSLTCVVESTPAALQTISARLRPMPKMCVSAMPTCLLVGMLTPAIRAIAVTSNPGAACAAGLRKSRAPHRGGERSCTSYKSCELTFLLSLLRSGAALLLRFPITAEVRLLEQPFVLVSHHVSLHLRHEVHRHDDDDQQRRSAEVKRHAELQDQELRYQADGRDVQRAPEREPREHLVDVLGRLLPGANAGDERARLPQVLRGLARIEHERRVEEAEEHDQRRVQNDV